MEQATEKTTEENNGEKKLEKSRAQCKAAAEKLTRELTALKQATDLSVIALTQRKILKRIDLIEKNLTDINATLMELLLKQMKAT